MRELNVNEIDNVEGGNAFLVVLAAGVLVYNAANILYEFGQGVGEGYSANIK